MSNLKPIIALVKAYRGGEWLEASLESVRRQCAGVVVVLSNSPWSDVPGSNHLWGNCQEPLNRFKSKYPLFKVIVNKPTQRQNTEEQYKLGMTLIREHFGDNHGVLLLDTDEIWEEQDLLTLREAMSRDKTSLYFVSGIWTYLRSPLWQVTPKEGSRVAVGLAFPYLPTGISRLANLPKLCAKSRVHEVNCSYHHFGYVRNIPEEITSKLVNSTSQDKTPVLENWKERIWDKLPLGKDIHPQRGFEKCWGGVREIPMSSLPKIAIRSDAFWSGLIWHSQDRLLDLFVDDEHKTTNWRDEVENLPPSQCPVTTVSSEMLVALSRLASVLGKGPLLLPWLLPRLRMSFRETVQLALLTQTVYSHPRSANILEIGSGLGGSMATMLLACNSNTSLTAIDPYLPYDEENVVLDRNVKEGSVNEFYDTVSRTTQITGQMDVHLIKEFSSSASIKFPNHSLDLLLVDGNHSYASCKEDLELWWDKVKNGGLVLVHDYASRFPGVIRAVKEFESKNNITFILPVGSTLAYLRKS